jgi:hypothetical protein
MFSEKGTAPKQVMSPKRVTGKVYNLLHQETLSYKRLRA